MTDLAVRFSGLLLLDNRLDPNPALSRAGMVLAPGPKSHDHFPRLCVDCEGINWAPTDPPDELVGLPAGGCLAIWNLAPGDRVDLPGNTGGVKGSAGWVGSIVEGCTKLSVAPPHRVQTTNEAINVPIVGGTLADGRFATDAAGKKWVYGYSWNATKSGAIRAMVLDIVWTSEPLANPAIYVYDGTGALRLTVALRDKNLATVAASISNEPRKPCDSTGTFEDWLSLYDQLYPLLADRVVPYVFSGPMAGSGFCPPGGFP